MKIQDHNKKWNAERARTLWPFIKSTATAAKSVRPFLHLHGTKSTEKLKNFSVWLKYSFLFCFPLCWFPQSTRLWLVMIKLYFSNGRRGGEKQSQMVSRLWIRRSNVVYSESQRRTCYLSSLRRTLSRWRSEITKPRQTMVAKMAVLLLIKNDKQTRLLRKTTVLHMQRSSFLYLGVSSVSRICVD